jgi:hypothetical protein
VPSGWTRDRKLAVASVTISIVALSALIAMLLVLHHRASQLVEGNGGVGVATASPSGGPKDTTPGASASATRSTGASATPSTTAGLTIIEGTWTGTATCQGGRYRITVVITPLVGTAFRATLRFSPAPDSTVSVETGSFAIKGRLDRSTLIFDGDYWIERPPGYVMGTMSAVLPGPSPTVLSGPMSDCDATEGFHITRQSGDWYEPPPRP